MYGRSSPQFEKLFGRNGIPFTVFLIGVNVISFFWTASARTHTFFHDLVFLSETWPRQFWTAVSYPLFGGGHPLMVLCACAWAYWVCGSLERSWGWRTFIPFFLITSTLTAIGAWVGTVLLHEPTVLAGLFIGIAPATIAWCRLNRRESILFYGVLPIPAPFLALLTLVLLWYAAGPPFIGLFALLGCLAAYIYVNSGRHVYQGYSVRKPAAGGILDKFTDRKPHLRLEDIERLPASRREFPITRWFRERKERQQLEKLFRNSGNPPRKDGFGKDKESGT